MIKNKRIMSKHSYILICMYIFFYSFLLELHVGRQCGLQLSEGPVSGASVDQSQDRKGTCCCCHQTDGPNGPRSLKRKRARDKKITEEEERAGPQWNLTFCCRTKPLRGLRTQLLNFIPRLVKHKTQTHTITKKNKTKMIE